MNKFNEMLSLEETNNRCFCREYLQIFSDINPKMFSKDFEAARGDKERVLDYIINADMMTQELNYRINRALQSKAVKTFIKKYRNFTSGYTMGESTEIDIYYQDLGIVKSIVLRKNHKIYKGLSKKYNYKIVYGKALLKITLGKKNKYETQIFYK